MTIIRLKPQLNYANVMSTLAVFLVLGGGAAFAAKSVVNSSEDVASQSISNSDVKKGSLRSSRLRDGAAVGDRDIISDSLTGDAINESTLNIDLPAALPPSGAAGGALAGSYPNPDLGTGAVDAVAEADRERTVAIEPGSLLVDPASPTPTVGAQFGMQVVSFSPSTDGSVLATTEVPLDRAPGSGMQVRLLWDANGTGDATWNVAFRTLASGDALSSGPTGGTDVPATSQAAGTVTRTVALDLQPGAIENGDALALTIKRNADVASDTLPVFSRLYLVEISYTATG